MCLSAGGGAGSWPLRATPALIVQRTRHAPLHLAMSHGVPRGNGQQSHRLQTSHARASDCCCGPQDGPCWVRFTVTAAPSLGSNCVLRLLQYFKGYLERKTKCLVRGNLSPLGQDPDPSALGKDRPGDAKWGHLHVEAAFLCV